MGMMVKQILARDMKLQPHEIYHVTLMPCYDKKLEASRSQFATNEIRDVDCVVTPGKFSSFVFFLKIIF